MPRAGRGRPELTRTSVFEQPRIHARAPEDRRAQLARIPPRGFPDGPMHSLRGAYPRTGEADKQIFLRAAKLFVASTLFLIYLKATPEVVCYRHGKTR